MSVVIDQPPKPGEIVRVRSRRYLVEAVEPAPRPEDQTLVRLSCLEDDAEGEELEVLWEKEVDAQRVSEADWSRLAQGHFDLPRHFAAYYRTLRWNTVTSTDPKLFQAPYRAGIRIDAYQLEPLRKALLLPRVNLFIADDVGLGKTIEAGGATRRSITLVLWVSVLATKADGAANATGGKASAICCRSLPRFGRSVTCTANWPNGLASSGPGN